MASIPASDLRRELIQSWDRELLLRETLERIASRGIRPSERARRVLEMWEAMYRTSCWGGGR